MLFGFISFSANYQMGSLGQTEAGAGSSKVLAVHASSGGHYTAGAGSLKVLAVRA